MIAIPALDLRDNACVQLVGGSYKRETIRLDDPIGVATRFRDCGFRNLHVVDLDAATGRGSNAAQVRDILGLPGLEVQVGGGVRTLDQIENVFQSGAARVIIGTRAIEDLGWLQEATSLHPRTIMVAVDVRDRQVVTHGWTKSSQLTALDAIGALNELPLAAILVTAVHKEGQMLGTDLQLMEEVVAASSFPVHSAGGISGLPDLRALADRGVGAAIIGMALYTGALDPRAVAEEFTQ